MQRRTSPRTRRALPSQIPITLERSVGQVNSATYGSLRRTLRSLDQKVEKTATFDRIRVHYLLGRLFARGEVLTMEKGGQRIRLERPGWAKQEFDTACELVESLLALFNRPGNEKPGDEVFEKRQRAEILRRDILAHRDRAMSKL